MFRRLWSGLPPTWHFPTDLGQLGYFVNEDDEVRSIESPRHYFKYFIDRNTYRNDCQRFSFSTAVQRIVLERLAALGVEPLRLPPDARPDEPHVRVLATDDLLTNDRVLVFVGETAQDLGILAYRVVGGAGGIDRGSIVSMVRKVRFPDEGAGEGEGAGAGKPPAILICNPGELFWWPDAQRSLSLPAVEGMPRPSAAHLPPRRVPGQNDIPGHETPEAHVASTLRSLLGPRCQGGMGMGSGNGNGEEGNRATPRITAIGLAGGADALAAFLDDPDHWQRWGPHMDSLVSLGGLYEEHHIKTDGYRSFLRRRARAYIASEAPVDTPVAGPDGNDQAVRATRFGCPVHSAGTQWLTEIMFIDAQDAVLRWGAAVARNPAYANPNIDITYAERILSAGDTTWADYREEDYQGVWDDDEPGRTAAQGGEVAAEATDQGSIATDKATLEAEAVDKPANSDEDGGIPVARFEALKLADEATEAAAEATNLAAQADELLAKACA